MAEQLLEMYKTLTEEAQKEAYDFIMFLAAKSENVVFPQKKKIGDDFLGSLHKYANPSLIEKEESAWSEAAAEKYGNDL